MILFAKGLFPSQISFKNLTCDPSLITKFLNPRKSLFTLIRLAQKCESPLFYWTCTRGLVPRYLLRMICGQVSSIVNRRYNHLLGKAMFFNSKFCIPSPPKKDHELVNRVCSLVVTRASVAPEVLGSTPHRSEYSGI